MAVRDGVLVQALQLVLLLLSYGLLVQVTEVLHGRQAAARSLLGDVELLHQAQVPGALVGVLERAAVVTLKKNHHTLSSVNPNCGHIFKFHA